MKMMNNYLTNFQLLNTIYQLPISPFIKTVAFKKLRESFLTKNGLSVCMTGCLIDQLNIQSIRGGSGCPGKPLINKKSLDSIGYYAILCYRS